jgi:hypothetical protein
MDAEMESSFSERKKRVVEPILPGGSGSDPRDARIMTRACSTESARGKA